MKLMVRLFLIGIVFVYLFSGCFFPQNKTSDQSRVCIRKQCVIVEVVANTESRARGLQKRSSLALDHGMLFIFDRVDVHRFWMKDTWIPLDMIWLNDRQEIVHVEHHVPPCQENPCPSFGSDQLALYVLEVNAGLSRKFEWQIGDRADFFLQ